MKKLIAIIAVIVSFGITNVNAGNTELTKSHNEQFNKTELNILPYGKCDFVPMTSIFTNGEYSIYKVEADFVNNIPSCQPVGENYRYFVYKSDKFVMTVNECNKEKIFKYITK